jgi:hypothetical protein
MKGSSISALWNAYQVPKKLIRRFIPDERGDWAGMKNFFLCKSYVDLILPFPFRPPRDRNNRTDRELVVKSGVFCTRLETPFLLYIVSPTQGWHLLRLQCLCEQINTIHAWDDPRKIIFWALWLLLQLDRFTYNVLNLGNMRWTCPLSLVVEIRLRLVSMAVSAQGRYHLLLMWRERQSGRVWAYLDRALLSDRYCLCYRPPLGSLDDSEVSSCLFKFKFNYLNINLVIWIKKN